MDTFLRFLYEFLSQFFNGIIFIFEGIIKGVKTIFNIPAYLSLIHEYKNDFSMPEWLLVGLALLVTLVVLALIVLCVFFLIRKYIRIRKTLVEQESLLEEVANLNDEVSKLVKEKEDILAMKVSKLGLRPDEADTEEVEEQPEDSVVDSSDIRFPKLYEVDQKFAGYKIQNYNNAFELPELCDMFRNFAASKLGLYYILDENKMFFADLKGNKHQIRPIITVNSETVVMEGIGTKEEPLVIGKEGDINVEKN